MGTLRREIHRFQTRAKTLHLHGKWNDVSRINKAVLDDQDGFILYK